MKLQLGQTLKDIFKQENYCKYLVFFALLSSFGGIVSNANNLPFRWEIYTIASVILYIPLGYVINFVHSRINESSEENTFSLSAQTGMKLFIALITNTIIAGIIISGVLVAVALITKFPVEGFNNPKILLTNPVMFCVTAILALFCVLLFTFMNVKFADKYSIKDTFNWFLIFKPFFKKIKDTALTLIVLGLIFLVIITVVFAINIALNYGALFVAQALPQTAIAVTGTVLILLSVTVTVVVACIHYIFLSMLYTLLADIYKSANVKEEVKADDELSQLQTDATNSNQD
ncbi:MAG: hypothetical protein DKM24_03325 [Candidatus Melainabacteria bacterium]|nr:MAG: hypothetical protein DKM24_03325 [Candidatus Melainabacteria bacterium]